MVLPRCFREIVKGREKGSLITIGELRQMSQDGVDYRQSRRIIAGGFGLQNRQKENSKQYCADVIDLDSFLMSSGQSCVEFERANSSIQDCIVDTAKFCVTFSNEGLDRVI